MKFGKIDPFIPRTRPSKKVVYLMRKNNRQNFRPNGPLNLLLLNFIGHYTTGSLRDFGAALSLDDRANLVKNETSSGHKINKNDDFDPKFCQLA